MVLFSRRKTFVTRSRSTVLYSMPVEIETAEIKRLLLEPFDTRDDLFKIAYCHPQDQTQKSNARNLSN